MVPWSSYDKETLDWYAKRLPGDNTQTVSDRIATALLDDRSRGLGDEELRQHRHRTRQIVDQHERHTSTEALGRLRYSRSDEHLSSGSIARAFPIRYARSVR